jgi:hypothetical protein
VRPLGRERRKEYDEPFRASFLGEYQAKLRWSELARKLRKVASIREWERQVALIRSQQK